MQSCEGLDSLLNVADFDLSGKQARSLQNNGEEFDAVGEHIVKAAQADALSRNAPTVADDCFEAVGKLVVFVFLAAVKCHAFGVVAYADKGITVVAVEFFVFIVVTNQRVTYPHGDKGRQNHENKDKPNNAARNVKAKHGQDACQAHKTTANSSEVTTELTMPRTNSMVEAMKSCASCWIRWSILSGA